MIRIIGSYVSPYVRKVLACMALKCVDDYEIDPITPFFGGEEFGRLSPLRRIPVLIRGDLVLNDSTVICAWLDEEYPGHPLLPAAPADRAKARWLEEYADTRLGDLTIWGLFYQRVVGPLVWGDATHEARVEAVLNEDLPGALDYLEGEAPADGFLFGEIGLADIGVGIGRHLGALELEEAVDAIMAERPRDPAGRLRPARRVDLEPCIGRIAEEGGAGRRQALLDAGAPLVEKSVGTREPQRGMIKL